MEPTSMPLGNELASEYAPIAQPRAPMHWWAFMLCIAAFTAGFWLIDHTPFASDYFKFQSVVAETDNRTADRIEAVNLITAPVRIFMGFLGLALLFVPVREKLRWGGPIFILMLVFVAYCGASIGWSINKPVTAQKFAVLCFFGVACYGTARYFSIRELAFIFTSICVVYIGIGLLAEIGLGNFTPHKREYRFVGTCHPNSLAVYGTFGCLVSVVYLNYKPGLNRWLVILFAVGIITLLLTKSRTTLAAFVLAAVATWFLTFKPNNRVFAVATILLLFVTMGMALALSKSNVRAAAAEKMAMGRTKDVSTLTGRLPLWEVLVDSIEERPLTGYGYLAFWDKQKIEVLSDQLKWEIPHGHNMYLDVALDGGLIALALFASIFLVSLVVSGYRATRFHDRDAMLVFGFLVFATVHGLGESLFKLPTFLLFMLVVLLLRMAFEPVRLPDSDDQPAELSRPSPIPRPVV